MADSTADEATNADTLTRELQKVMTEILYDGGGKDDRGETEACLGVVKAIDEAISILTCLRNIESKKPESPVEVPKEFICTLSNTIMIEPVIIASGQTYEKRYITEWLKHERTCPKTKQVVYHRSWIPNHLINEVIMQWCRIHNFDRPKPSDEEVIDLFTGDIESLLQRITSPSSVEDQTEAAKELALKAKRFTNVCVYFVAKIPDSITRLLTPLSVLGDEVDSNPEFLDNIVTALLQFSTIEKNKTLLAENPLVLLLLAKSMKQGTLVTRKNSAVTVHLLSETDSNRLIVGKSEALLKALIYVIDNELATTEAFAALYNLCIVKEIREKAVLEGLTLAITKKIKAAGSSNVERRLLTILALSSTQNQAIEEMDKLGFIYDLFSILRDSNSMVIDESALIIVVNICKRYRGLQNAVLEEAQRNVLLAEENKHGTFTRLAEKGAGLAVIKAQEILDWIWFVR